MIQLSLRAARGLRRLAGAAALTAAFLAASGVPIGAQETAAPAPAAAPSTPMIGLTTQTPPIGADPRLEEQVKRLSAELRCPVCQGLSLQDSPSELAQQMRAVIRDQLASGRSEDEVRQYFVDKYGTWILLEPEREGFSLLVWLLPAGLLFGGGVLIYVVLRKWTRAPADAGDSAVTTQA